MTEPPKNRLTPMLSIDPPKVAKADLFRAAGIPVGPALLKPVVCQGPRGRGNDRALSARITFMSCGPLNCPHTQAEYMTATVCRHSSRQGRPCTRAGSIYDKSELSHPERVEPLRFGRKLAAIRLDVLAPRWARYRRRLRPRALPRADLLRHFQRRNGISHCDQALNRSRYPGSLIIRRKLSADS